MVSEQDGLFLPLHLKRSALSCLTVSFFKNFPPTGINHAEVFMQLHFCCRFVRIQCVHVQTREENESEAQL